MKGPKTFLIRPKINTFNTDNLLYPSKVIYFMDSMRIIYYYKRRPVLKIKIYKLLLKFDTTIEVR